MANRRVRLAMLQMECVLGDVAQNLATAENMVAQAGRDGAQLACLPELFSTGYNPALLGEKLPALCADWHMQTQQRMFAAAQKAGLYLVAPYGVPVGPDVYNAAVLFGPNGQKLGQFFKRRGFGGEGTYLKNGWDFPLFETAFGRVGLLICYDAGFPENARQLCLSGAELIVMPSAWRIQDERSWHLNLPSRALENQLFTMGVNRVGREGDLHLFGKSMVCGPWGDVVEMLPYDEHLVKTVSIDLDEVARCRAQGGYLADL